MEVKIDEIVGRRQKGYNASVSVDYFHNYTLSHPRAGSYARGAADMERLRARDLPSPALLLAAAASDSATADALAGVAFALGIAAGAFLWGVAVGGGASLLFCSAAAAAGPLLERGVVVAAVAAALAGCAGVAKGGLWWWWWWGVVPPPPRW